MRTRALVYVFVTICRTCRVSIVGEQRKCWGQGKANETKSTSTDFTLIFIENKLLCANKQYAFRVGTCSNQPTTPASSVGLLRQKLTLSTCCGLAKVLETPECSTSEAQGSILVDPQILSAG